MATGPISWRTARSPATSANIFKKRPGHWRAPQPGVIEIGYSERQAEILPNGQLHEYWYALAHGKEKGAKSHDKDLSETVCN